MSQQIGPNPEERQRMVADALKHTSFPAPAEKSDIERLLERLQEAERSAGAELRQRYAAESSLVLAREPKDVAHDVSKALLNQFVHWSKEELLMALVCTRTEIIMEEL